jgi:peptidoglycan hydrolase-like protein with peptidoglycan-binding domain
MKAHAGARLAAGLLTVAAMLVAALVAPSVALASHGPAGQPSSSLLRSASWHGRAIQRPLQPSRVVRLIPRITTLSGWSAGPARRGLGFVRAGGSDRVREVQRLLIRIGYRPGAVDGRFGPRTAAAVIDFQIKHGLRATGVVGARTLLNLREGSMNHWPSGWKAGPVERGSGYSRPHGSERVRSVQQRLNELGFGSGPVDGLFGPRTAAAVESFQRLHGLALDGVVGRRTLRALGLAAPLATPRPTQTGRKPGPHAPSGPPTHHPDITFLVLAGLVLLGLLTSLMGYMRTTARIRRYRAEEAQRRWLEQSSPPMPEEPTRIPARTARER